MSSKFLSFAFALLISSQACFAANLISCPPPESIRANNQFSHPWIEDKELNRWSMESNIFKYHLADWNTHIAVPLPNIKNQTEAIEQGTVYFKYKAQLSEPTRILENGYAFCYYTSKDQIYAVMAVTPPIVN